MSENPYGQPGPSYRDGATASPPDARTSVLAVLSFISGLGGLVLCCIPIIGLLGVLFGVPALISISASRGQKRGTGLAVTGIVLGLLGAAIGAALYAGSAWGGKWMVQRAEVMTYIEAQDVQETQARFSSRVRSEVTAERIAEFRDAYHAEVGAHQGAPDGLFKWMMLYGEVSEDSRDAMGELGTTYEAAVPVAVQFDQQPALVVAALDPNSPTMLLLNVGVMRDDGSIIWLLPAPTAQQPPGPDLAPSPAPAVDPEGEPDAPGGEGGG